MKIVGDSLKDYGREITALLEKPTWNWKREHQPDFIVTDPVREGDTIKVVAGVEPTGMSWKAPIPFNRETNDAPASVIYLWVTRGTKAHTIAHVDAPWLEYWTKYSPSTGIDRWNSVEASNSFERFNRRFQVMHPGIAARNFEERAAEEKGPGLAPFVQAALTKRFSTGTLSSDGSGLAKLNKRLASMPPTYQTALRPRPRRRGR